MRSPESQDPPGALPHGFQRVANADHHTHGPGGKKSGGWGEDTHTNCISRQVSGRCHKTFPLISHVTDLSYITILSCKGGWEILLSLFQVAKC